LFFLYSSGAGLANGVQAVDGLSGILKGEDTGGLEFLDRQRVFCPTNQYLGSWSFMLDGNERLAMRFKCMELKNTDSYQCEDKYTAWNDRGDNIYYLDRHRVECPEHTALGGWEGITGQKGNSPPVPNPIPGDWKNKAGVFAIHYTCCSAEVSSPTMSPISLPTIKPTQMPTRSVDFSAFKSGGWWLNARQVFGVGNQDCKLYI